MSVAHLSALLQDSVQPHAGVLVDVDVGEVTLLSDGEVLLIGVDGNGADTIAVLTVERYKSLRLQVVGLVLVTSDEDDFLRGQEMNIVTLH